MLATKKMPRMHFVNLLLNFEVVKIYFLINNIVFYTKIKIYIYIQFNLNSINTYKI